ncbi:MBL fold metallo-hydrolase [bacterium]|nr:MBL fold metallo-hydrolase [bacterium]
MVAREPVILVVGSLQTNCYLVGDTMDKTAVCIDPGANARMIISEIENHGWHLAAIALTHGHADHLSAIPALRKKHHVPVFIHKEDGSMMSDIGENLSVWLGEHVTVDEPLHLLEHGAAIPFGSSALELIHTPGHTRGSACLLCRRAAGEPSWLFSGDTLFQLEVGRTDLAGGDWDDLVASITTRLYPLPDSTKVFPGHGPSTTIGTEKKYNPYVKAE